MLGFESSESFVIAAMSDWDFTITLTKDEVLAKYIAIPEFTVRRKRLLTNLNNSQMVSVILHSMDTCELYSMDLKRAAWNPNALMLVPSNGRANDDSGIRFFRDFNLGRSVKLGFKWEQDFVKIKIMN
ncbi:hypothetical protein TIFTF001_044298 [Ficus carica]|uniref:Uncharacterized protein n=1 Tax=Ficus carica TaxID=3494 RepID=A0AA87Z3W9_FICCA|nr:hypothetical protein TIFTF001_044298 [Ficus carica]